MTSYDLTILDVAVAASLILVNGVLSVWLRLGLERRLLVASLRTVVQLALIGFVLRWLFASQSKPLVAGLLLFSTIVAGTAAVRRTAWRFDGIWLSGVVAVAAAAWAVLAVVLVAVIPPAAWWDEPARYAIPLMGMILGNALNGIALGLDRVCSEFGEKRDAVLARLALGATRWEAARDPIRTALRTGMLPILNSMSVVGLVSLPGMMTGQILAGEEPLKAVSYQIVIMFVIAAATALGTTGAVLLTYRRLFNTRHQFEAYRLRRAES